MPYSGSSDQDLPDDIKKMPKHAREIFVSTFNSVHKANGGKDTGPAGNAHAIARAAAKKWIAKKGGGDKSAEGETQGWAFFGPMLLEGLQELPQWIPLHKVGTYHDPRYGEFSFTEEKALNAIANFYAKIHRPEAPLDAQVPIDTRHSGDGACGWLGAVAFHNPYLVGMPDWTPKGEEIVTNKLFRFVSPLYGEQGDDVLLKEVTLTNRDFLKMPSLGHPIMLSADIGEPTLLYPKETDMKQLDETFAEHETAVREAFRAQFVKKPAIPTEPEWYPYPKIYREGFVTVIRDGKLYKIPYTVGKDKSITFGDWQEVEITFKPVKGSKKKGLDQVTEETWKTLDDGMRLDIHYRLTAYDDIPDDLIALAKWTRKFINSLPNAAFAVIEPAYTSGKTDNKNARHLPHHTASVKKGTEDSTVDLSHYRNARARANQIKPVTDSISTDKLRSRAQSHLDGHKGVLKKTKKQEAIMPEDTKKLTIEQMEQRVKELEGQLEGLQTDNKDKTDRIVALERERHALLVGKHIKTAETRGVAPIIVKLVEPVLIACHQDAERIIALEAEEGEEEKKANIFEMMVRLLEECPTKLGALTKGPEGKKLEEKPSDADQTVEARLKELEEAEERVRESLKRMGLDVVPAGEDAE